MKLIKSTMQEFLDSFDETKEYYVQTPDGYAPILGVIEKYSDIITIEHDGGVEVVSDDHPLLTENGILTAKDITPGTLLQTIEDYSRVNSVVQGDKQKVIGISIPEPHLYVLKPDGVIHHNTALALYVIKSYLDNVPDSVCIFYDSEHGTSLTQLNGMGIDTSRILHTPISSIEELKFDMVQQLDAINPEEDKVIFLIDSLGMLASNKEATDAMNQKSVSDMTKAKEFASLVRLLIPRLTAKGIPCIAVNHVYQDISSMYGGKINAGGEKLQYGANTIIHISKAQEKDGKDLVGFTFTMSANKSRHIQEKKTMPLVVTFEGGINKYSGLFDLALELGWIIAPKQGWYKAVNKNTGEELHESNLRRSAMESDGELFEKLFNLGFEEDIYQHFTLFGTKTSKSPEENTEDTDDEEYNNE